MDAKTWEWVCPAAGVPKSERVLIDEAVLEELCRQYGRASTWKEYEHGIDLLLMMWDSLFPGKLAPSKPALREQLRRMGVRVEE